MARRRTLRHAKSKRTIHVPPAALRSHTYQPPSLVDLCEDAGLDANEAERWFVEQDVPDVDAASELTLGELQEVIGKRATVGKVRRLHRLLERERLAAAGSFLDTLEPTAASVFPRTMLQLRSDDLKGTSVARLTNESIFASLMLTITVSALIDKPDVAADCEPHLGEWSCARLLDAYAALFGIASAFFLGACLVTLGAVNTFVNVSAESTTHFIFTATEL